MAAPLRLLTWNIFMMPAWTLQSPGNQRRAAAIAAELLELDYDILCFQKAFDGGARDVLWKALRARYPHRYGPANSGFSIKIGSGVWVLSRAPLSGYREIEFRESAGIEKLSRKGAMMLAGVHEGNRFQILATHLQGDDAPYFRPDRQKVRDRQTQQIRAELVLPRAEPGVPLFVCGCFGTPRFEERDASRETESYRLLLRTLDAENGPLTRITLDDALRRNDMAQDNKGRTSEQDYVLVRPNGRQVHTEWTRLILRRRGWDGPRGRRDLSYRYAVGAEITFGG
jgi:hypothetical protein